ncbi:uncharacterized protein FA14DRAFT_15594 [Meira miltonrushii]|uniref:Transcriptional regulatory protein RXT2 N-terminal domain-containing protein n=1 Tax=Meira miltonrushii TaxID=1280837 RepID=A0A316VJ74_9BASI|nr:uncharacterized protein FA14DRAFT_15594 [Meira miltonrushii]PWN37550.1 hypothetical protein FA14DRAFT_15594 [Meira miltonrushii]
MSDLQANVSSLPEQNISDGNQPDQLEPSASTDVVQQQEGTDGVQIPEHSTTLANAQTDADKQHESVANEVVPEQSSVTVKQEEPQKQAPTAQTTSNEEAEEGELEQNGSADVLEAAALESQLDGDKQAPIAQVTSNEEAGKGGLEQQGPADVLEAAALEPQSDGDKQAPIVQATSNEEAEKGEVEQQGPVDVLEAAPSKFQSDGDKQAPMAQVTSNEEGEESEFVQQGPADAQEAAALESQTDGDIHLNGHAAGPSGRAAPSVRQDEMSRIRKENEDMRLLWLSLPSHDHPSYYSDTDEENASSGSSCAADVLLPRSVAGRAPYLNGDRVGEHSLRQKRKQDQWPDDDRDDESDLNEEEDAGRDVSQHEKQYRIGNRGNKLKKNSRWVRKHKLGTATDARNEKDITERFTDRLKALQRTQVESMLNNAPGPSLLPIEADMLDGSDRLLLKDLHTQPFIEETSILLAPQLLRPILSTRALLQSHTLRHTFRNPHIGALSRTALDLRESESQISRSLTRCLKAMEERIPNRELALVNGDSTHLNGILPGQTDGMSNTRSLDKEMEIDPHAVGVEGTQGTDDELNPSFAQLDRLFVTKEGLPIPFGGQAGEDGEIEMARQGLNGTEQQTILTADQQREVIRAALECLHELGGDSLEYVERLEEVRSRLAAVKQKRLKVWNALRIWALKREGDDFENDIRHGANENDALTEAAAAVATNATSSSNSRPGTSGQAKTNAPASGTKRRRVAA